MLFLSPQKVYISDEEMKSKVLDVDSKIKFIFVGGAFFRKGVVELIKALEVYEDK